MAYNSGLFSLSKRLHWGIIAHYFGLLGLPGNLRRGPFRPPGWNLGSHPFSIHNTNHTNNTDNSNTPNDTSSINNTSKTSNATNPDNTRR